MIWGARDCGYRSLAGAMAFNEGQVLSSDDAARRGATLRYQAISHLRNNLSDYKEFILPDKAVAPEAPTPNHYEFVEQFLWDAAKAHTWICGVTLLACAKKQGVPIVIWYNHENTWKRCTLAPGFDKNGYAKMAKTQKPVILRLQDKHYCWVEPPSAAEVPRQWLTETFIPRSEVLKGSAPKKRDSTKVQLDGQSVLNFGNQSSRSVTTPSVHSVGTPSVHSVGFGARSGYMVSGDTSVRNPSPVKSVRPSSTPSVHSRIHGSLGSGSSKSGRRVNSLFKKLRRMSQAVSPSKAEASGRTEDPVMPMARAQSPVGQVG